MLRNTKKERVKVTNTSMLYGVLFGALLATSAPTEVNAQTLKAYEKAANKAYIEKDFYNAAQYYQIVLASKQKTALYFKYAEASRLTYAYEEAAKAYERVLLDSKERGNYPLAQFEYANCLKHLARYTQAYDAYNSFIQSYPENDFIKQKAQQELQACVVARNLTATPNENIVVTPVSPKINTEYSDFAPSIKNGIFFFSSLKYKQEDVAATKTKGKKQPKQGKKLVAKVLMQEKELAPILIETLNQSDKHTANLSWAPQGDIAFFTICEGEDTDNIQCQIWQAKWDSESKTFTDVKALPESVNMTGYNNTHPHIAFMQDTKQHLLLFTSNRPGGQGKMDIWASEWKGNNTWGVPFNLGRTVNTPDDEATPYYNTATQYLYFSSNWHYGMGGFDVFKSKRIGNTVWQTPQNLGLPYNSAANDLYFVLTDNNNEEQGYLSSNRTGSMTLAGQGCCNDIYKFEPKTQAAENLVVENKADNNIYQEPTVSIPSTNTESNIIASNNPPTPTSTSVENTKSIEVEKEKTPNPISNTTVANTTKSITPTEVTQPIAPIVKKVETPQTIENTVASRSITESPNQPQQNITTNNNTIVEATPKTTPATTLPTPPQPATNTNISNTTTTSTSTDSFPQTANKELLEQKLQELNKMLPLTLYFHNDEPDSNTVATSTDKPYELPYHDYVAMQSIYEKEHAGQFTAEVRQTTLKKISDFFEFDLKGEYNRMNFFFDKVLELLENGAVLDITIKGYTSPRSTERYNHALAQRRIASVRKQLFIYKKGIFLQYFQAGKLSVNNLPLGETTAPKYINDRIDDPKNSIYSIEAAKERRAEIIVIRRK